MDLHTYGVEKIQRCTISRRHKGFGRVAAVRYRGCDEVASVKSACSGAFFFLTIFLALAVVEILVLV
jgi:hypothetical protein